MDRTEQTPEGTIWLDVQVGTCGDAPIYARHLLTELDIAAQWLSSAHSLPEEQVRRDICTAPLPCEYHLVDAFADPVETLLYDDPKFAKVGTKFVDALVDRFRDALPAIIRKHLPTPTPCETHANLTTKWREAVRSVREEGEPTPAPVEEREFVPCPFCGGEVGLSVNWRKGLPICYVVCETINCYVQMEHPDPVKLADAWNRRASRSLPAENDAWLELCRAAGAMAGPGGYTVGEFDEPKDVANRIIECIEGYREMERSLPAGGVDVAWDARDLVEHFAEIRVDRPGTDGEPCIDNIGREWIEDHFDHLVYLLRASLPTPTPERAEVVMIPRENIRPLANAIARLNCADWNTAYRRDRIEAAILAAEGKEG